MLWKGRFCEARMYEAVLSFQVSIAKLDLTLQGKEA